MPFKSKAQQRFMFSQHPEMAKEWASKTDFKNLPEHAKKMSEGGTVPGYAEPEQFYQGGSINDHTWPYNKGGNVLDANARKHIAAKNFAGPDKSYPIHDIEHARNALARVSQYGTPAEIAHVRAKVHAKYPSIGHSDGGMIDDKFSKTKKLWSGGK